MPDNFKYKFILLSFLLSFILCFLGCRTFSSPFEAGYIPASTPSGSRVQSEWSVIKEFEYPLRNNYFVDDKLGWVVGYWGNLYRTKDGSRTWINETKVGKYDLLRVFFINKETNWAVGREGKIFSSIDKVKTWIRSENPTGRQQQPQKTWVHQKVNNLEFLYGTCFTDTNKGCNFGIRGLILRTSNGERNWEEQICAKTAILYGKSPINNAISKIVMIDKTGGFSVGESLLYTADKGNSRQIKETPSNQWLYDISFKDDKGYIVGLNGTILTSDDGGRSWQQVSGVKEYLYAVSTTSSAETLAKAQSTNSGWMEQLYFGTIFDVIIHYPSLI